MDDFHECWARRWRFEDEQVMVELVIVLRVLLLRFVRLDGW